MGIESKKGELTSNQIIVIIVAIFGFLIVLIALYLILNQGYDNEKDLCKLSIVTRATVPELGKDYVPLKCTTSKICITEDSGRCEKDFAGESNVLVMKIGGTRDEKARKIAEITVNAMWDCWDMTGQGKFDLFPRGALQQTGLKPVQSACLICSRVAVDKSVEKDEVKDNNGNNILLLQYVAETDAISNYMKNTQVPGHALTYLQMFTDKGVSSFAKIDENVIQQANSLAQNKIDGKEELKEMNSNSRNNQIAIVFMQIRTVDWTEAMKKLTVAGATVVGTGFSLPVVGGYFKDVFKWGVKKLLFTPAGIAVTLTVAGATIGYTYANVATGKENAHGYCGAFTSTETDWDKGDGKGGGCSLVQAVPYNFQNLNILCKQVEGNL